MAFPADIFTAYTLVDNVNDVLATHPNALSVDLRAVEIKIGIDGSAVAASWDYFLKDAAGAYRTHRHDGGVDDGAASIGPLTGLTLANNVDMGNYQVRAKQFYADVATGTAPLVISSTTQVSNLNVDRVDNVHLPGSVASILTDHNKANHDALNIDADTLDGYNTAAAPSASKIPVTDGNGYLIPFLKIYDTGWIAVSAGNVYTITHGLGTKALLTQVAFSTSSDGSANVSYGVGQLNAIAGSIHNSWLYDVTTTQFKIRFTSYFSYQNTSGNRVDVTSGYIRIIALGVA